MKREVCFLIGAKGEVLWSDASSSPLALPDSRERWEAIWSRRTALVEIAHSHPLGPEAFSEEDRSTMRALDDALGRKVRFSLVTPAQYLVRGEGDEAVTAVPPAWVAALRTASGLESTVHGVTLMNPLEARFTAWEAAGPTGDATHRARLEELAKALRAQLADLGHLDVLFVCTHNSRRSHLAQLLGIGAARYAGLTAVRTFSGGTEVTAFNPRAVDALQRAGFEIGGGGGENPVYEVRLSSADAVETAFSKKLDDPANPSQNFVAVMTCTQADAACPFVKGATRRVSVPYEDPKVADGTAEETQRYDERVEQLGRDLVWVMRQVSRG